MYKKLIVGTYKSQNNDTHRCPSLPTTNNRYPYQYQCVYQQRLTTSISILISTYISISILISILLYIP